jgi:putative phage-type endonuclease
MTADEITRNPDEWHEYRESSIGASEIAVLLGLAPKSHGNPFSLFVQKKTGLRLEGENRHMRRGRRWEDLVAEDLADLRPDLLVLPGGLYRDEHCPWMTATYDRFTVSREVAGPHKEDYLKALAGDGQADDIAGLRARMTPAEVKTALSHSDPATGEQVWGEPYTDEIPDHYKCQAYWQMAIWGGDMVHVPVTFMGQDKTELYVVSRTDDAEADIQFMVKEAALFLERLDNDDPPDLDWTPETGRALRTLHPLEEGRTYRATKTDATRLRSAYLRMKAAEERYGKLQNMLGAKAAGAQKITFPDPEREGQDVTVMSRSTYDMSTIDVEQLRKTKPALARSLERKTPVDKWTPGRRWMNLGRS